MSNRLRGELERLGYRRDFLIMNGNGGMISARFVARDAAKTVMSGPASGVIAAAYTGKRAGHRNLVTYDMGGTSTDVALILDAEPAVSNEIEIEYAMPIHVPMVAVHTVGAGGGSIARVDASGLIQVGPESAGANPGPICYGRGGTEPTITDANLLLGRLDPKRLLAVDAPVTVEQVEKIFEEKIGRAAGLDAVAAAGAVLRLGNIKMAGAIRMVSVSRGHDPQGLRAVRLRRRRAAACNGARARTRPADRAGARAAGHHQRAGLRRRRSPARFRQHDQPAGGAARRSAVSRQMLERHGEEGRALIAKEAVEPETIRYDTFGRHAVCRPDAYPQRAAALGRKSPAPCCRSCSRRRISRASRSSCRKSAPTSSTSTPRSSACVPTSTCQPADRPGRARSDAGRRTARERGRFGIDGGWLDTPVYAREKLPLDAVIRPGDHRTDGRDDGAGAGDGRERCDGKF